MAEITDAELEEMERVAALANNDAFTRADVFSKLVAQETIKSNARTWIPRLVEEIRRMKNG